MNGVFLSVSEGFVLFIYFTHHSLHNLLRFECCETPVPVVICVCLSAESQDRNGLDAEGRTEAGVRDSSPGLRDASDRVAERTRETNGLHVCNARLKAYGRKLGLFIPKVSFSYFRHVRVECVKCVRGQWL